MAEIEKFTQTLELAQALDWAREALERMRAEVAVTRAALAAVREVVEGLDADACDTDAAALARDVLAVLPPEDTTPDLDFRRTVPPVVSHVVQPLDLVLWARAALERVDLEKPAQEVTDNRHPATGNDPGRGSATTEKP